MERSVDSCAAFRREFRGDLERERLAALRPQPLSPLQTGSSIPGNASMPKLETECPRNHVPALFLRTILIFGALRQVLLGAPHLHDVENYGGNIQVGISRVLGNFSGARVARIPRDCQFPMLRAGTRKNFEP